MLSFFVMGIENADSRRAMLKEITLQIIMWGREHADSCPQHNRCTDILITDNNMPDMTGIELLEIQHHGGCRLTSKNKALVTGNEDPVLQERAAALGCHFFLKPLSLTTLFAWLKECEERFDLSEPLASDLYLPSRKEDLFIDSP
jgi:CheY-like chemotaxis protein